MNAIMCMSVFVCVYMKKKSIEELKQPTKKQQQTHIDNWC